MRPMISPAGGQGLGHAGSRSDGFELKPLVTPDEEMFIAGNLNAEEYLSRVAADGPADRSRTKGYERVEFLLSASLAVAGVAFFAAATTLLSSGGDHALVGLLVSGLTMLAVQLAVELRRRGRHKVRG